MDALGLGVSQSDLRNAHEPPFRTPRGPESRSSIPCRVLVMGPNLVPAARAITPEDPASPPSTTDSSYGRT
jgi:hypothetical protein